MEKINEKVYLLPGYVNIGLIAGAAGLTVIDTGIDKASARKIIKAAEELSKPLIAIINTHGHADHFGGNSYLVQKTQAKVYAPSFEEIFIKNPELEPQYLFSGAKPIKELNIKFLLAKESPVDYIISENTLVIDDLTYDILALPGHTLGQIGIALNNVVFTADAFFPTETLTKHAIPFFTDWEKSLETLSFLEKLNYDYFIPAHGPLLDKAELLIALKINRGYFLKVIKDTLELLEKPKTSSKVLEKLIELYQIKLVSPSQYYLLNTTVMACLSYLQGTGQIEFSFNGSRLEWKKIPL